MIKIIYDHYLSKIEGLDSLQFTSLKDLLKYEIPYMNRHQISLRTGFLPDKWKYLINKNGYFYSGLLQDVEWWLGKNKIEYELEYRCEFSFMKESEYDHAFIRLEQMPVTPRDYQIEAILTAVDSKRGVVVAGTGAGKGVIIAGICTFIYEKTLILLDSVDIAEQLAKEITEYTGIQTGLIKGGRWETDQLITVAVIDSVHSKTKGKMKKEIKNWIDSINVLIIDECHHASAPTYESFLEKCKASYRFGLTATAMGNFYKGENGLTSNTPLLKGILGPAIWMKTSIDLINEGYLSIPDITMIEIDFGWDKDNDLIGQYSEEEKRWIIENEERNMRACKIIQDALKRDLNVIVFINRVEHGKILVKMLEDLGVDSALVRYANGQIVGPERQKMFKEFKSGEARVLIGTVLNEGLNFQIGVGINLGAGQSPRTAVQRLGRILRKPRGKNGDVDTSTPSYTSYYDFKDKGHPIFVKHGKERQKVYEDLGLEVKIVKTEKKKKKKESAEEF